MIYKTDVTSLILKLKGFTAGWFADCRVKGGNSEGNLVLREDRQGRANCGDKYFAF